MLKLIFCLVCVGATVKVCYGCVNCFMDQNDINHMCMGYTVTDEDGSYTSLETCTELVDSLFDSNHDVLQAARVGRGHDEALRDILRGQLMPIVEEFRGQTNNETVYQARLSAAQENFTAQASLLPRASECFPPCGFQVDGVVYSCQHCTYYSCEYPLDCPAQEVVVGENNRTQMRCDVLFPLPSNIEVVWRFATTRTQLVELLKEVTAGTDRLYSIPKASSNNEGTYQCEIFTEGRSIIRLYFYVTVVPYTVTGHSELQDIFQRALMSEGQQPPVTLDPGAGGPLLLLPSPSLLTSCLTGLLLLLLLSLMLLLWSTQHPSGTGEPLQTQPGAAGGEKVKKYVVWFGSEAEMDSYGVEAGATT